MHQSAGRCVTAGSVGASPPGTAVLPAVAWGPLESHGHSVQFYSDDAFLLDGVSRFIGAALGGGDAGIVIATPAHRTELERRLRERGVDIATAAAGGRYVVLDAAETLALFMRGGRPDAALFAGYVGGTIARAAAAAGEGARLALFGEMVAVLWAQGQADATLELERLWNDLGNRYAFSLHCAYPMRLFERAGDDEFLGRICTAHGQVLPAESYTSLTEDDERLRAITLWQQKAQALEREIEEHKAAQDALRQKEQALRQSNQELRLAVAARDEFLSVAAHELKTPVTGLRGFAQLLLRDARRRVETSPERIELAVSAIDQQSTKLQHLIARLLDSAQIEAGKLRIAPVPVDLVALVEAALVQQHSWATHTFGVEGPAHLPALVDPVRFEQVITNLLDNAVKFSPPGSRVTVGLGQGDGDSIVLSVTDQGVGIPPEQRETIFGRFHQAHSEAHLSGLGLGLYITREIVELHGGVVRVEEPEHGGTRVVVLLPPLPAGAGEGTIAEAV